MSLVNQPLSLPLRSSLLPEPLQGFLQAVPFEGTGHQAPVVGAWQDSHFLLQKKGSSYCSIASALNGLQFAGLNQRVMFSPIEMHKLFRVMRNVTNQVLASRGQEPIEVGGANAVVATEALNRIVRNSTKSGTHMNIVVRNGLEFFGGDELRHDGVQEKSLNYFYTASCNFPLPGTSIETVGGWHSISVPFVDWQNRVIFLSDQVIENPRRDRYKSLAFTFDELAQMALDGRELIVRLYEVVTGSGQNLPIREIITRVQL